jgi:hypothetical protein
MTVMTAGTGGFSGSADATGPNAGYDPVMKFRGKIKKKDAKKLVAPGNKLGESRENPTTPSRLFQYKVNIPEVGETVIYANSPAELQRKLRMVIMPSHRKDISIERILPGSAGKFFMDKRMKHMRNVQEQADAQVKQQQANMKINMEKKKIMLKKQELQKQLQAKTQQLKKQARAGAEIDATR